MNKHLPDIRTSIDNCFSDLDASPSMRYQALARARGEVKVKKKLSVGLIFVVILILAAVTALAAVLLSPRELIDQVALPMANESAGESYSAEGTNALLQLADENHIQLSENTRAQIQQALDRGEGYFKEEMLMALAKAEFGDDPSAWTLEQQKWFDDVCVVIGFISEPVKAMPSGGEEAKLNLIQTASDYLRNTYEVKAPLDDAAKYRIGAQYLDGNADGEYTGKYWSIDYTPLSIEGGEYWVYLRDDGTILGDTVRAGLQADSTVDDVRTAYNRIFGSESTWSQSTLRAFQQTAMMAADTTYKSYLCLAQTTYPDIPSNAIRKEEARALAAKRVGLDVSTTHGYAFLIGAEPNPVWKVLLVQDDIQWSVELDCITGEIRTARLRDNTNSKWWMMMVLWEVSDDVEKNWVDASPSVG